MNHTPTKSQWQTVIDNLKKVPKKARLDMCETSVCETVNCVGGWYVVATGGRFTDESSSYRSGANSIANALGFRDDDELEDFLKDNPSLWGNDRGLLVFCDEGAYYHPTRRPHGAQTLQDVIEHFEEVRDRSPE